MNIIENIENKFYVYVYLDPNRPGEFKYNNFYFEFEPFYVGKGCGYRCQVGLKDEGNYKSKLKFSKIKSIVRSGSLPIVLKVYDNISEDQATLREIMLITEIGKKIDKSGPLTNITDGGGGMSGYKHTSNWKENLSKPVQQFSKDHILINEYKSISEASISTGIKKQNIGACASGRYRSSGGFVWKFKDGMKLQGHIKLKPKMPRHKNETKYKISKSNSKMVYQFSISGEFIKDWASIKKASIELNIKSSAISYCISGKYFTAGGFVWRSVKTDSIEKINRDKVIIQYDKSGKFIKEWLSANEVERELGYSKIMIRACCRGVKKSSKGFIWRYKV